MKTLRFNSAGLADRLRPAQGAPSYKISEKVKKILDDVRNHGDDALIRYTRKFDKVRLAARQLQVSEDEINGCYQNIRPEFIQALKTAIENVRLFYARDGRRPEKIRKVRGADGICLAERVMPLQSVGIYVPAGTAPLISTVYMTVIPAQAAGVEKIYVVTPPNAHGSVDPHILAAANLLKVTGVFKAGGAQAIGALAFGTRTIPRVDKIIGPGNAYVAEAKRQVFGYCDIDMIAGPTELVVIANDSADPEFVCADLLAQGEHAGGSAILITPSKKLIKTARKLPLKGYAVRVRNIEQAIALANQIAPEHLQIMIKRPERFVRKVRNAGAVFLGAYSPTAIGDYIAGPSHVLPTNGSARFFSGLGLADFLKSTHIISYNKKALERVRPAATHIAGLEGLKKHAESIHIRFAGSGKVAA